MVTEIRKKRDRERKDKTRAALLESAARVFVENGYHGTHISDIVRDAGVGQGTFYRFFENKRQIFEVLLDRFIETLFDEFVEMSANLPRNVEEYRAASLSATQRVAKTVSENLELASLLFREGPSIDAEMEERFSQFFDRFAGLAKFYLNHAVEQGLARPCRSDIVAQCLVGIGVRLFDAWNRNRFSDVALPTLIKEVVDFAFLGFGPPGNGGKTNGGD